MMVMTVVGLASPPVHAVGLACPQLSAVRLASLAPAVARRVETRVRQAVWRPRDGDIARVIGMIRNADPSATPLAINNYLVGASCPIIAAQSRGEEVAQAAAVSAFASKVQKALY